MKKRFLSEKGFTAVELIIVLVIIGTLLAVGIPRYIDMRENSERSACIANQKIIEAAIQLENNKRLNQGQRVDVSQIAAGIYTTYKYLFENGKTPVCPKDNRPYTVRGNRWNGDVSIWCPNGHREGR